MNSSFLSPLLLNCDVLLDTHSHYPSREGEKVILQDVNSVGLHPWNIDKVNVEEVMHQFIDRLQHNENKQIVAIGECGLDKLCTISLSVQKDVFLQHVQLSECFQLPLIIHCVKALDELLVIKKELSPTLPWIWHGFRGKPQQLEQLIRAGFYISFGFKYNKESLLQCPLDRMLLETDENPQPISLLYKQVSDELGIESNQAFPKGRMLFT